MSLLISPFPYCLVSNPHLLSSPLVPHSFASFLCPHSAAFLCRRRERRRSSSYTPLLLYSQHSLRRQEGTTTTTTTIRRGQHEADWRNSGKFLCNGVNDSSGGGRVRIAQSSSADEKEIPEEAGEEEEASLSIDDLKTSLRTSLEGVLSFPLSYFAASCPMGFFFFFFFLMYRILFLSYEVLLLDVSEIVLVL